MTNAAGTWRVPAMCAAIAVALGVGAAAAAADGHGVTALVHMQNGEPMTQIVGQPFSFVGDDAHYDGVYYYAIARDPLARGEAHLLIDRASYHYGHPGYGWLGWVVSGGGQPRAVPYALLVVSLLGLAVAGAGASVLARDLGLSPWWGLSVALNPGLLFAVTVDTSETVGIALALLAVLAWTRERWLWAGIAIAAGCFTKEPLLFVPAGLFAWESFWLAAGRRPSDPVARLSALAVGPALYIGWLEYCGYEFGVLPSSQINQLAFPPSGWLDTLHRAAAMTQTGEAQIGMMTTALLVAVGGLLALGLVRAVRMQGPLDPVFILLAVLTFSTNWTVLLAPKDLIRTIALQVGLLPFVVAGTRAAAPPDRPAQPAESSREAV